jgi:predicted RNA methylase
VEFVLGDIGTVRGPFDTVLMNPPFGTKKAHADLQFLECAVGLADVVYSIHKASTREFLEGWLKDRGFGRELIITTKMEIPHQFPFHRKRRGWVEVDAIRIKRRPKHGTGV